MELFFWVNYLATIFSLCESCTVLGIAYNTEEYFYDLILPSWVSGPIISYINKARP